MEESKYCHIAPSVIGQLCWTLQIASSLVNIQSHKCTISLHVQHCINKTSNKIIIGQHKKSSLNKNCSCLDCFQQFQTLPLSWNTCARKLHNVPFSTLGVCQLSRRWSTPECLTKWSGAQHPRAQGSGDYVALLHLCVCTVLTSSRATSVMKAPCL